MGMLRGSRSPGSDHNSPISPLFGGTVVHASAFPRHLNAPLSQTPSSSSLESLNTPTRGKKPASTFTAINKPGFKKDVKSQADDANLEMEGAGSQGGDSAVDMPGPGVNMEDVANYREAERKRDGNRQRLKQPYEESTTIFYRPPQPREVAGYPVAASKGVTIMNLSAKRTNSSLPVAPSHRKPRDENNDPRFNTEDPRHALASYRRRKLEKHHGFVRRASSDDDSDWDSESAEDELYMAHTREEYLSNDESADVGQSSTKWREGVFHVQDREGKDISGTHIDLISDDEDDSGDAETRIESARRDPDLDEDGTVFDDVTHNHPAGKEKEQRIEDEEDPQTKMQEEHFITDDGSEEFDYDQYSYYEPRPGPTPSARVLTLMAEDDAAGPRFPNRRLVGGSRGGGKKKIVRDRDGRMISDSHGKMRFTRF